MANPTTTPIMTPASGPGGPLANPFYLVDQYGNPMPLSGGVPVTVSNANANGQNTKVNSQSVVIASDQSSPVQPLTVELSPESSIRASHGFVVATGDLGATVGPFMAVSFWNPNASGKVAHFVRINGYYTTTVQHPTFLLYKETSDPSSGWTAPVGMTPTCSDLGSANTSVLIVNRTSTGNLASLTGTLLKQFDSGASANCELIVYPEEIKVPPNSGLTIYIGALNTTHYAIAGAWFEETL